MPYASIDAHDQVVVGEGYKLFSGRHSVRSGHPHRSRHGHEEVTLGAAYGPAACDETSGGKDKKKATTGDPTSFELASPASSCFESHLEDYLAA